MEKVAYTCEAMLAKKRISIPNIPPFEAKPGISFLGIVPVREDSKGLRRKNMKLLGGRPLYRWVVDAAKASGVFSQIVVMSDWEDLLDDARKCGYDILHEPKELTEDHRYVGEAMAWALGKTCLNDCKPTYVQLLQATAPYLKPHHIQTAASMITYLDADMVVGITPSLTPTAFTRIVPRDWSLKDWYPEEFRGKRRQDFPQTWGLNGYIYLAKREVWAEQKDWWKTNIYGYPMSAEDHIEIDTQEDFEYAKWLLHKKSGRIRGICSFFRKLFVD